MKNIFNTFNILLILWCIVIPFRLSAAHSELHTAAEKGDIEGLKQGLEAGLNINEKDDEGHTPLHSAVYYQHLNAVKLLVYRGADMYAQDEDGMTPVNYGIFGIEKSPERYKNMISFFVSAKYDLNFQGKDNQGNLVDSILYNAIYAAMHVVTCSDLETRLVPASKSLSVPDPSQYEPLVKAECIFIEDLLTKGANPNLANSDLETPLHRVCLSALDFCTLPGCYSLFDHLYKLLISHGAKDDAKSKKGQTPAQLKEEVGERLKVGQNQLKDLLNEKTEEIVAKLEQLRLSIKKPVKRGEFSCAQTQSSNKGASSSSKPGGKIECKDQVQSSECSSSSSQPATKTESKDASVKS